MFVIWGFPVPCPPPACACDWDKFSRGNHKIGRFYQQLLKSRKITLIDLFGGMCQFSQDASVLEENTLYISFYGNFQHQIVRSALEIKCVYLILWLCACVWCCLCFHQELCAMNPLDHLYAWVPASRLTRGFTSPFPTTVCDVVTFKTTEAISAGFTVSPLAVNGAACRNKFT